MTQDMFRQFPRIHHGFLVAQFHKQAVHQRHKNFKQGNIKANGANRHNAAREKNPVPFGAVGEICVYGNGVGIGYQGRKEETGRKDGFYTAQRF